MPRTFSKYRTWRKIIQLTDWKTNYSYLFSFKKCSMFPTFLKHITFLNKYFKILGFFTSMRNQMVGGDTEWHSTWELLRQWLVPKRQWLPLQGHHFPSVFPSLADTEGRQEHFSGMDPLSPVCLDTLWQIRLCLGLRERRRVPARGTASWENKKTRLSHSGLPKQVASKPPTKQHCVAIAKSLE